MHLTQSAFLSLLLSSVSLNFVMSTDQVVLGQPANPPSATMRTRVLSTLSHIVTVQTMVSIFPAQAAMSARAYPEQRDSTLLAPMNKAVMALVRKP